MHQGLIDNKYHALGRLYSAAKWSTASSLPNNVQKTTARVPVMCA